VHIVRTPEGRRIEDILARIFHEQAEGQHKSVQA
jgi:hypothetical protein